MLYTGNDIWAVIGPGRTGSKLIVDCIRNAYSINNTPLRYIWPTEPVTIVEGSIIHNHNIDTLSILENTKTKIIISTRDMVESSLSWCIQEHTGKWHLYSLNEWLNVKITPFKLDLNRFYQKYHGATIFYKKLAQNFMQNKELLIIDYSEFKNDPTRILKLIGLDDQNILRKPFKNPGSPETWISNWNDIKQELSCLERIPEIYRTK